MLPGEALEQLMSEPAAESFSKRLGTTPHSALRPEAAFLPFSAWAPLGNEHLAMHIVPPEPRTSPAMRAGSPPPGERP